MNCFSALSAGGKLRPHSASFLRASSAIALSSDQRSAISDQRSAGSFPGSAAAAISSAAAISAADMKKALESFPALHNRHKKRALFLSALSVDQGKDQSFSCIFLSSTACIPRAVSAISVSFP